MYIGDSAIEEGSVFFIAEAGVNHNGDLDQARRLIDIAAGSGADAVKFQTFSADRLVTERANKPAYQHEGTGGEESQYEMLKKYELDQQAHEVLMDHCRSVGITFLSTPFDRTSADMLDSLDVAAIKIGSGDLTNHPLLDHVAQFGRPIVLSTGMATLGEVDSAFGVIRETAPDVPVVLLHCTSMYPTSIGDVNMRAMETMAEAFTAPIGYSDHTTTVETPGFAVAAGARVVEKHFTIDRSLPGPDHEASLEPSELERCVSIARNAALSRGRTEKQPVPSEEENRRTLRRSLHAATPIARGEPLTDGNVEVTRPADGLPPADLDVVLGATCVADLDVGAPITAEVINRPSRDTTQSC